MFPTMRVVAVVAGIAAVISVPVVLAQTPTVCHCAIHPSMTGVVIVR